MKLFKGKEKGNNSIKDLLKKLKRHDTKVVAVAVVIALILSGGLIYLSTPIVANSATEEFLLNEKETSKETSDKLAEIREYLTELDKTVTNNQKSLRELDEKTNSTTTTDTINSSSEKLHTQSKEIKSDTQKIILETEKITSTINDKVSMNSSLLLILRTTKIWTK